MEFWAILLAIFLAGVFIGRWWFLAIPIALTVLMQVWGGFDCPPDDRCEVDAAALGWLLGGIWTLAAGIAVGLRRIVAWYKERRISADSTSA